MEGPAARDMEQDCLIMGWHLAGQDPGEQLFLFSCRAAVRDRDTARLMGPCGCPEGWGRWEDCSLVRQRAGETRVPRSQLGPSAGPQSSPMKKNFPNTLLEGEHGMETYMRE